jgi:hypothetical protein
MIVLVFADADPGGWQMGISITRKLQAFKVLSFSDLEFRVFRVALTPDQVRAYGLPSTPLKETERRADAWREAMGVEQTEIDALASLRPDLLRQIALDAIAHFYDDTLSARVRQARIEWLQEAQEVLHAHLADTRIEELVSDAQDKVATWAAEIEAINGQLAVDVDELELPEIEIPEPEVEGEADDLLMVIDSDEDFAEQCRSLIESKRYGLEARRPEPSPPPKPPRSRKLVRLGKQRHRKNRQPRGVQ